jgi:hypothetical protein
MKHKPPAAAAPFTPIALDADVPTFEQLIADPEIAELLEFVPVPRRCRRDDGWTSEMQRKCGWHQTCSSQTIREIKASPGKPARLQTSRVPAEEKDK